MNSCGHDQAAGGRRTAVAGRRIIVEVVRSAFGSADLSIAEVQCTIGPITMRTDCHPIPNSPATLYQSAWKRMARAATDDGQGATSNARVLRRRFMEHLLILPIKAVRPLMYDQAHLL